MSQGFLDMEAAAEYLCRSPRWIRSRLTEIPHYRPPGGQILFSEDDLRKWMAHFKVEPKAIDLRAIMSRVGLSGRRRKGRAGQ